MSCCVLRHRHSGSGKILQSCLNWDWYAKGCANICPVPAHGMIGCQVNDLQGNSSCSYISCNKKGHMLSLNNGKSHTIARWQAEIPTFFVLVSICSNGSKGCDASLKTSVKLYERSKGSGTPKSSAKPDAFQGPVPLTDDALSNARP